MKRKVKTMSSGQLRDQCLNDIHDSATKYMKTCIQGGLTRTQRKFITKFKKDLELLDFVLDPRMPLTDGEAGGIL